MQVVYGCVRRHGFLGFRGFGNTCHRLTAYATPDTCHRLTAYATPDTCHRLTVYATADTRHRLTVYAIRSHFYLSRAKNFTHSNRTYQHSFFNAVHSIQAVPTHLPMRYLLFRGRCVLLLSLIESRSLDGVLLCHLRL